ncbi:CBS domain-containing protein [Streptomyces sp. NPDC085529]|uniref:CBS domain-containing protein n=1 Tax=Streptomyces sp. NPDC085529 TaxID=3365729 RepID=UPI0037CFC251
MTHEKVGALMTDAVVPALAGTTFREVAKPLAEHDVNGLPVVDDDEHVVGVVSESDLPARRAPTVRGVMSAPAVTVHAEEAAADAAPPRVRRGVERLPVVDEEERLVGIVTRRDLLRVFLRPDPEIRRRIREEILADAMELPEDTVDVHVRDGVVTLAGRLRTRGRVVTLLRPAARVDGVGTVVDRLSARDDDHGLAPSSARTAYDLSD